MPVVMLAYRGVFRLSWAECRLQERHQLWAKLAWPQVEAHCCSPLLCLLLSCWLSPGPSCVGSRKPFLISHDLKLAFASVLAAPRMKCCVRLIANTNLGSRTPSCDAAAPSRAAEAACTQNSTLVTLVKRLYRACQRRSRLQVRTYEMPSGAASMD